jgi:MFS family permease
VSKTSPRGQHLSHPKGALVALSLLTALNLLNYIDRYVLPGVQPIIQHDFHLNDSQIGRLTTAFFLVYMFAAPLTGWLGDRYRRKPLIIAGAIFWSALTLLTAVVHSYGALLFRHAIVGIGEASFGIFAPALIADYYPEFDRNRVLTIFYTAIPLGAALGYLVGGTVGGRFGWRAPFYVAAVPGFIIAILLWIFLREPARGASDEDRNESVISTGLAAKKNDHVISTGVSARENNSVISTGASARAARERAVEKPFDKLRAGSAASFLATLSTGLLKNPAYMLATLGMAMMTFSLGGIAIWMPTFLVRFGNYSLSQAGFALGAVTAVTGILGTATGGVLAQRWLRTNHRALYLLSAWSMLLGIPAAMLAFFGPRSLIMPAIFAAQFCLFLNTGPLNAAIVNSVSATIRASAIAVELFVIHILGDVPSPQIIGWVSDHSNLRVGLAITLVAMLASALCLFAGARYAKSAEPRPRAALT